MISCADSSLNFAFCGTKDTPRLGYPVILNIIPFICDLQQTFPIFTQDMLDKFHILELTEYSRGYFSTLISFRSATLTPYSNSPRGVGRGNGNVMLKDNLVIAWKHEPSQGGLFMLRPCIGKLAELQEV